MAQNSKKRTLSILTRDGDRRDENPLLTDKDDKYYLPSSVRTPELRKEADALLYPSNRGILGMKVQGSPAPGSDLPAKVNKAKGLRGKK